MKVTVCVIIKAPHHIIIAIKFSSQQVYVHGYTSAAQKIKKLSETPATAPIVAKLCFINCKNKKTPKDLFNQLRQGGTQKGHFTM